MPRVRGPQEFTLPEGATLKQLVEKGLSMSHAGVGAVVRLRKELSLVKDVPVLIAIDDVSNSCLALSIARHKDLSSISVHVSLVLFIFLSTVSSFLDRPFSIYFSEIEKAGVVRRGSEVIDSYKYVELNSFSQELMASFCYLVLQYNSWFVFSEYGVKAKKPIHAHQLEMVHFHATCRYFAC